MDQESLDNAAVLDSERRESYRDKQETIEKLFDIKVGRFMEPSSKEKAKAARTIVKYFNTYKIKKFAHLKMEKQNKTN